MPTNNDDDHDDGDDNFYDNDDDDDNDDGSDGLANSQSVGMPGKMQNLPWTDHL